MQIMLILLSNNALVLYKKKKKKNVSNRTNSGKKIKTKTTDFIFHLCTYFIKNNCPFLLFIDHIFGLNILTGVNEFICDVLEYFSFIIIWD